MDFEAETKGSLIETKPAPETTGTVNEKPAKSSGSESKTSDGPPVTAGPAKGPKETPATSLFGPPGTDKDVSLGSMRKRRQSLGTDRTSLQYDNNYSNTPLSSPPIMRKLYSGKFNRESGGMSIGTPLKQPPLNVSLRKSADLKMDNKLEEKSQNTAKTVEPEPFKTGKRMTPKEETDLKYTDLKYGRGFFTGRSTMSTDSLGRSLGGGASLSTEGNIKKGLNRRQENKENAPLIASIAPVASSYTPSASIKHMANQESAAYDTGFRKDADPAAERSHQVLVTSRRTSNMNIFSPEDKSTKSQKLASWTENSFNPWLLNKRYPAPSDKQSCRWSSVSKSAFTWKK